MDIKEKIAKKLHPGRLSTSGKMSAILGWLVEQSWTNPSIDAIVRTSDNFVLFQLKGDIGCNEFVGSWSDFKGNVIGACNAAGLTKSEMAWVETRLASIGSTC